MFCPETFPIILGHTPEVANTLLDTSDAVKLTNAKGVLIVVQHYRGGDTDVALTVHEGATAAIAKAGTYAITETFPIWVNTATGTNDTMVRQTDAVGYTIDAGVYTGSQLVCFYIDAAILTATYDWVHLGAGAGNGASIMSVLYILDGARYQQTTPPTAIA